jgi:predicted transcriptional regulator
MASRKVAKTFRLSDEARAKIEKLAEVKGVTQVAILEMAVREMWARARADARKIGSDDDWDTLPKPKDAE